MMLRLAVLLLTVMAGVAAAQDYPALHGVSGVAADDVLNIRRAPDPGSEIIGSFQPDEAGIEVMFTDPSGRWARVNAGERAGWTSLGFLTREDSLAWHDMYRPVQCFGTEPFWSLELTGRAPSPFLLLGEEMTTLTPIWESPVFGHGTPDSVVFRHSSAFSQTVTVLRAEACNDGMSDREYGLGVTILSEGPDTFLPDPLLRGCCTLGTP